MAVADLPSFDRIITRELLRSELFGHEPGAFTGAMSRTAGLVARLDGGTLLMD